MIIKVIGSGCPTCKKLFDRSVQAVKELGLEIEVEYVKDINEAMALGAMQLPVLAINGKIVLSGRLPDIAAIKEIIAKAE